MDESLTPDEKIRKRRDFLYLYKNGKRYRGKYFKLIHYSNNLKKSRIGIVVGKKVGNAVVRNKVKRWMRTLFRKNKNLVKQPMDILIIFKQEIKEASMEELRDEYMHALQVISQTI
ncbi:MAG: ribonuclease P protein component [Candidatus Aminicenantes bacterium]|nr:ribonuclease P protein component [Candidatus Aminicenantes bacterium]